jgi:N,N'-diacetyllegionaminate synthase
MKLFQKNLETELLIIAEIGVNHEGSLEKAIELVNLAASAGADAVKFQSYSAERLVSSEDRDRLARVRKFALDEEQHKTLVAQARKLGISFLSTAVSEDWVPFLAENCDAIKIASGDLTFEPVIRAAAATGKPIILSTGLGTTEEVEQAIDWVRSEIGADALADRLALMQCIVSYPTPIEEASVRAVPFMQQKYGLTVGYSNHVIGAEACYAAVALGAPIIEVHFTDNKEDREFRDHQLSFDPGDLKSFVVAANKIKASLGAFAKEPQPCELPVRGAVRKGLVASRPLIAGSVLTRDDLMYARPASEFPASDLPDLIGRTLKNSIETGEIIKRSNIVA